MTTDTITTTAECPECVGTLALDQVEMGEIMACDDCGAELEVRSLHPLSIMLAPEEAEDWGE
jgi:alpha-aminoadipate carrier protein LysW